MIEYLNKFSKKEVDKFRDFILSLYYNKNKSVIKLFNYLASLHPNLSKENTDIKIILRKVFRMGRGNAGFARKIISMYLKVFEKFLIQLEVERYVLERNVWLLDTSLDRSMPKLFEKITKEFKKLLVKNNPVKISEYYFSKSLFKYEQYLYEYYHKNILNMKSLQNYNDNLDHYYFLSKINYFCNAIYAEKRNSSNKAKCDKTFYSEIVSTIENNRRYFKNNHHFIYTSYLFLMILEKKEDKHFLELLNYRESHKQYFKKELLWRYEKIVEYYMSSKSTITELGNSKHKLELFKIYDLLLMKRKPKGVESLMMVDQMRNSLFLRAVMVGLHFKKYEWVKQFMDKYKKKMNNKYSDDTNNLSLANYYFSLGDYIKATYHVRKVSYGEKSYHYYSKILILRTFFETGDVSSLEYEIDSISKYLRRKKEYPPDLRKYFQTFIKYIRKLIKLKESNTPVIKSDLRLLRKEIDNEKELIINRDWFYEKLFELEKDKKK